MAESNYNIQQYFSETSLVDIEFESVKIKKIIRSHKIKKPNLSIGVGFGTKIQKTDDKKSLLINTTLTINAKDLEPEGEENEIFTAEVVAESLYLIDFESEDEKLIEDLEKNRTVQQLFINQIYPVLVDHARYNLNKMGYSGMPIPFFLPSMDDAEETTG